MNSQEVTNNQPKFYIKTIVTLLFWGFCLLSVALLFQQDYKISGLSFYAALTTIGFSKKWNTDSLSKYKDHHIYYIYFFSWVLATWGILFDFFTGFLFLFSGFLILLLTMSYKDQSISRILMMIFNLLLSIVALFMHFIYSMKLGF
jgi:hypothetical protein